MAKPRITSAASCISERYGNQLIPEKSIAANAVKIIAADV